MKTRIRTNRWLLVMAAACLPSLGSAQVLWSENFDVGTPGQSLASAPFNWGHDYGDVNIDEGIHPGWVGNAVYGKEASHSPEGLGAAGATVTLPALPTTGMMELQFDAWAYGHTAFGGYVALNTASEVAVIIQAWGNQNLNNVWLVSSGAQLSSGSPRDWISSSNFMRDRTVLTTLLIDYGSHTFNVRWFDRETKDLEVSRDFTFVGEPQFTSLSIYEDTRGGSGLDIDNLVIRVVSVPVPEPATTLLWLVGLAGAAAWRGWRRQ